MDTVEFILIVLMSLMGIFIIIEIRYVVIDIIKISVHAELTHKLLLDYVAFVASRERQDGDKRMYESIFENGYEENKEDE